MYVALVSPLLVTTIQRPSCSFYPDIRHILPWGAGQTKHHDEKTHSFPMPSVSAIRKTYLTAFAFPAFSFSNAD